MSDQDVMARLWQPEVWATMVLAGLAFAALLWVLDIRPGARLFVVAIFPTVMFLAIVLAYRGFHGTLALLYALLIGDALIWSGTAFAAVMLWRWRTGRKR